MDFEKLNKQQLAAATYDGKHLLVLAGAGTGKTRTIKRKEKYRSIAFWTILVTIILGVISNIISHLVIKTYL